MTEPTTGSPATPVPNPIGDSLPRDSEIPEGRQIAFHAVVHLVIPAFDPDGNQIRTTVHAEDYVSAQLRGLFLDWAYVEATNPDTGKPIPMTGWNKQRPIKITVCDPYVERTFLTEELSSAEE